MKIITRKQAKTQQETHYFTGKLCKNGHVSTRLVSNGTCCACLAENKEYHKNYRRKHSEILKEKAKKYYSNNVDYIKTKSKNWARNNKEQKASLDKKYRHTNATQLKQQRDKYYTKNKKRILLNQNKYYTGIYYPTNKHKILQYGKEWRKNNHAKVVEYNAKRRALVLQATPEWYECDKIHKIYQKCIELNTNWKVNFQVDHIVPLQSNHVCGLHCWDNLQLMDGTLNNEKNNKWE